MNPYMLSSDAQFQMIFAVAIVVCSIVFGLSVVGGESKNAVKKIRKEFAGRILAEGTGGKLYWFLTENELIIQKYTTIFAVYRLDAIRYVSARKDPVKAYRYVFLALDGEKKIVKPAALIGGTAAGQKLYGRSEDEMPQREAEQLCAVIQKYVPGVEKIE